MDGCSFLWSCSSAVWLCLLLNRSWEYHKTAEDYPLKNWYIFPKSRSFSILIRFSQKEEEKKPKEERKRDAKKECYECAVTDSTPIYDALSRSTKPKFTHIDEKGTGRGPSKFCAGLTHGKKGKCCTLTNGS